MQFCIFECIKLACTVLFIHSNKIVSNSDGSTFFMCSNLLKTKHFAQQNTTKRNDRLQMHILRCTAPLSIYSCLLGFHGDSTRLASECALWVSSGLMRCCSVGLVSDGPCVPSASSVNSGLRTARHHLCCFSIPCLQFQSNPTSHADARAEMMRSASAAAETCLYE